MNNIAIFVAVVIVVLVVAFVEIAAAVLPLVIVLTLVPRDERHGLAELIAVTDSSRRLRLWPALRVAVLAHRKHRPSTTNRPGSH